MKKILNERPVVFAAFFFLLGITVAYYCALPFFVMLAGAAVAAVIFLLFFFRGKVILTILYCAVFFVGALLFGLQYNVDFNEIEEGVEYTVEGKVTDRQLGDYNRYTLSEVSLDDGAQTVGFSKKVYLYSKERLDYGNIAHFKSEVNIPVPARNPGVLDEKMYLAAEGVGFACFGHEVAVVGNEPGWYGGLLWLKESLAQAFDDYFLPDTAPVAKAMFLGVKNEIPEEMRQEFSETGIVHVLAISGLHITIISAAFLWALKKLKASRNVRFITLIAVLACYAVLTGLAPSVVRAVIMTSLILVGRWKFKERDMLTFLAAALFITLTFSTPQLFMPGFLISYGVVFGLLCLIPVLGRLFDRIHFSNWFSKTLSASCAASIAAFPLTAYYFHSISLAAPLANFYAVPLTMVTVVMCGMFALFCWLPPVAALLAFVPQVCIRLLESANALLAQTGVGYVTINDFPVWAGVAIFALLFICSDYMLVKRKKKAVIAAILAAGVALFLCMSVIAGKNALKVTILDVGTGDIVHISTNEGDYLIDNGGSPQRSQLEDYTKNSHIVYKAVLVTNDKTNNLEELAKKGSIQELYVPENYEPKGWEDNLSVKVYALYDRIAIGEGVALELGGGDGKNVSVILSLNGKAVCLLAQNGADELGNAVLPEIPVIKIAKGGAEGSVTKEMLDMLRPEVAVVSVKGSNKKGLPDESVLKLLELNGIRTYQTSLEGAVSIEWDEKSNWQIKTMRRG